MIAKRLIAALFAVGLVLGAWVVRDNVIEGDDDEAVASDDTDSSDILVCATELRDVCRTVAAELDEDLTVRVAEAGTTLDELSAGEGPAPMWLTFDPFPQMVDATRRAQGLDAITYSEASIATSPLAAVVLPESADALRQACGDPVDLVCLGEQTQLSPTFAPLDTGVGTLGVAAAVAAFGGGNVDLSAVPFLLWARELESAGARSMSGGTAVRTIQTRPTFAIAVGAEAELSNAQRPNFDVLYAEPMASVDVVLMVPDGVEPPDGLASALAEGLRSNGWKAPAAGVDNGLPEPGAIVAIRDFWERLS